MIHTTLFRSRFRFCFRFLTLFILSLPILAPALETCPTYTCPSPATVSAYATPSPPTIRFPFLVPSSNTSGRCGYPGFHLTCNKYNNHQTTLTLPLSGDFSVQSIDYFRQLILLSDPHNCLPNRLLTLNLSRSPFSGAESRNYTFLNCTDSYNSSLSSSAVMAAPVACLSGSNHTVYLTFMEAAVEELVGAGGCRVIKSVWSPSLFPVYEDGMSVQDLDRAGMALGWNVPDCSECERQGGVCGFSGGSGLEVNCSVSVSVSASGPDYNIQNG